MNAPLKTESATVGAASPLDAVRAAMRAVIRGKDDIIERALITLVAGGHLLIEDIPGVGKSTLAHALARSAGGSFRRIQFTSDLLPADLLGVNVWLAKDERFEFRPGPMFANFVLADEINRAPPRTQSALLEAMAEQQVSVDGTSHDLPTPFMVVATQNPEEHHGTYPLPESQRDRFLLRISMGYAEADVEAALLRAETPATAALPDAPVIKREDLAAAQDAARRVFVHEDIAAYAQRVVGETRSHGSIHMGVSTRGALAWMAASKARASLEGRAQVTIDDLQELAVPALAHRIVTAAAASLSQSDLAAELVREIVATVPVPV